MDQNILEHLAERISARSGLAGRVSSGMENPKYAYNETRFQYDSKLILKHLLKGCSDDTLRLIGVTHVDLYVPILKYVYGLAEVEGRCCLISTHRLRPEFYDQPPDPDLFLERVEKTALHELGHTFGLTHCRDRRCVMYSSTHIENTDFKQSTFCFSCLELFKWYLQNQVSNDVK